MLFLVGILPAFVALLVRWWVKEPDRWVRVHGKNVRSAQAMVHLSELFRSDLRRGTFAGSILAFVAVFGLWGATNWAPTLVRAMPDLKSSILQHWRNTSATPLWRSMPGRFVAIWHLDLWRIASAGGPCSD